MNYLFSTYTFFLSSKSFLDYYLYGKELDLNEIEKELFFAQRSFNSSLPNQIYDNVIGLFDSKDTHSSLIISFEKLQIFFNIINDELYVKEENFTEWQSILTHVNSLPLITYYCYKHESQLNLENVFAVSSLPTINNTFLKEKSFRELHIHINGTSEAIFNWLHFLKNQKIVYQIVKESYSKNNMQYKQLGLSSQRELSHIIERAATIREYLMDLINDTTLIKELEFNVFKDWKKYLILDSFSSVPYKSSIVSSKFNTDSKLLDESKLWYGIFKKLHDPTLQDIKKENLSSLVHFYILSMSLFNRFLVQQADQNGFSQFQLITDNGLRDTYEDEGFRERYLQLSGMNGRKNDLIHLELRFAPKKNISKMVNLYRKIVEDWRYTYKKNGTSYSISTVAHFIKQKDKCAKSRTLSCGYADLRKDLQKQADILISMFESSKTYFLKSKINYLKYFVGIDAAGNELYAKPEVFAPVFNYIHFEFKKRFQKKLNLTFHAGEDYVHLLSGIRYIWEAVYFLGMNENDKWAQCRIGHATSLGIDPQFWAGKLDGVIVMSKGEWLDSMIFAKMYLAQTEWENIYNTQIEELWNEIYAESSYNHSSSEEAYKERKIDPYKCKNNIVKLYNSPNVVSKSNEMHYVYINDSDINIMLECQRKLLRQMKEYNIAIESMITSNVRISYYDKYEEHHIYRWLFPDKDEIDIMPPIVLASDDPGLFSNNMRIEFSHLYEILKKKGRSESEIRDKIDELQKNASDFTFKNVSQN